MAGKLSIAQADKLKEAGLLKQKDIDALQEANAISKRQNGSKFIMKSACNKTICPQLYFKGLGKQGKYSKKMTEFRNEFNLLLEKYAKKETK